MVIGIAFPRREEQVFDAYYRYLKSLEGFDTELAPTRRNAELYAGVNLIPAWKRGEPILFATLAGPSADRIVGATFTTLPDPALEYRIPYAIGHGTWVSPDMRKHGVARMLLEQVRRMLRARGVKRQMGMAHAGNAGSKAAFMKMGFKEHGFVLSYDL